MTLVVEQGATVWAVNVGRARESKRGCKWLVKARSDIRAPLSRPGADLQVVRVRVQLEPDMHQPSGRVHQPVRVPSHTQHGQLVRGRGGLSWWAEPRGLSCGNWLCWVVQDVLRCADSC